MNDKHRRRLASILVMVLWPCVAVAEESIEDRLIKAMQIELRELKDSVLQEVTTQLELVRSEISEWRTDAMTASGGRMESLEALVRSLQSQISEIERQLAKKVSTSTLQTELGRIRQQLSTVEKKPVSLIPNSYERWQQSDTDAEPNSRNPQIRGKRLIATNEGVCFLVGVSGDFRGRGEQARVYVDRGYWYVGGTSKQAGVYAEALCAR